MTIEAKVEGLERFRRRVLAMVPTSETLIAKANQKSADEFEALVRRIIPRGDPKDGNLVNTLRQGHPTSTGVSVTIGSDAHHYPLHLEVGHRARDGSHVPGKAFWFPAKAVTLKRARSRAARAINAAIKASVTKE